MQVAHACQRDRAAQWQRPHGERCAQRIVWRQPGQHRQPQRQVTSGGVAKRDRPVEVKRVAFRQAARRRQPGGDVVECPRPAAAGLPNAPVFQAPRGQALGRQQGTQRPAVIQGLGGAPEAAVDHHDHGRRVLSSCRQPQHAELVWIGAVRNPRSAAAAWHCRIPSLIARAGQLSSALRHIPKTRVHHAATPRTALNRCCSPVSTIVRSACTEPHKSNCRSLSDPHQPARPGRAPKWRRWT